MSINIPVFYEIENMSNFYNMINEIQLYNFWPWMTLCDVTLPKFINKGNTGKMILRFIIQCYTLHAISIDGESYIKFCIFLIILKHFLSKHIFS